MMIKNKIKLFSLFLIISSLTLLLLSCSVDQEVESLDNESKDKLNYNENELITFIEVDGIGEVAIKLTLPDEPKFEDGAPIVVDVSTFLTGEKGFINNVKAEKEGFVQVSYLWPGMQDSNSGVFSDGEYDYGGENCQLALKEVILFTLGEKEDVKGNLINHYHQTLNDNVGLYAFSHPGIIAVNTLSKYSDELSDVAWLVGRENPTSDKIFAVELGYVNTDENPYYSYPEDYNSFELNIDYSLANYDFDLNVVYFDENLNNVYDESEFRLTKFGPIAYDKRYYSLDLTTSLNSKLGDELETWPEDVATLEEVESFWEIRTTVSNNHNNYVNLNDNLKVMLVFADSEHVQPFDDKPSIHQAYDGFTRSGNWLRLNPDSSYLNYSPDNDANLELNDWSNATDWAYLDRSGSSVLAPLAALNEMVDRTYYSNWDDNLEGELS